MKDPERKVDMYQILHIILEEQRLEEFQQVLKKFLSQYKHSEPAFLQYFEEYYNCRCGKFFGIITFIHIVAFMQKSGPCVSDSSTMLM